MLNLDTHVLLFAVAGRVTPREAQVLGRNRWGISSIVLWEIAKLAQLGRITVDLDDADVVRVLSSIHVWPITMEIAKLSTQLDVHSDPADELILATSLAHHVPLVTRDKRLKRSKLVRFEA